MDNETLGIIWNTCSASQQLAVYLRSAVYLARGNMFSVSFDKDDIVRDLRVLACDDGTFTVYVRDGCDTKVRYSNVTRHSLQKTLKCALDNVYNALLKDDVRAAFDAVDDLMAEVAIYSCANWNEPYLEDGVVKCCGAILDDSLHAHHFNVMTNVRCGERRTIGVEYGHGMSYSKPFVIKADNPTVTELIDVATATVDMVTKEN